MNKEEYSRLWKDAILLCENETNKDEAESFVHGYYNNNSRFECLDNRILFITFIGLAIYEEKFGLRYGSTSPASWCFQEILKRVDRGEYDKEFIYDVGDWAATYTQNPYIPMGTRRGFGPRAYFAFYKALEERNYLEKIKREEIKQKRKEEGLAKLAETRQRHLKRKEDIRQLRELPIKDCIQVIQKGEKNIFYYIDLIDDWIRNNRLSKEQQDTIISLFPQNSTKHNNRRLKELLSYITPPSIIG